MKTGKIPENVLKRAVLRQIGIRNGINGSGAGIGNDCAIFPFSGTDWEQAGMSPAEAGVPALCTQEAVLAWKEAPGIGDAFMTMAELIQKCANNLAAGGACPAAVMIALFVGMDGGGSTKMYGIIYKNYRWTDQNCQCGDLSHGGGNRVWDCISGPLRYRKSGVRTGCGSQQVDRTSGNRRAGKAP